MTPQVLEELRQFNKTNQKLSWKRFQRFLKILLSTTQCELSEKCLPLLKDKRFDEMLDLAEQFSSTEYMTSTQHRLNVQISALIRKYPYPPGTLKVDPEAKAIEKFLASEHKCKRVNQRFRAYSNVRSPNADLLERARSYVSYVLGEFDLGRVTDECDFGTGASVGVHGNATNFARKLLGEKWSVSTRAYHYARAALKKDFHIFEALTGDDGVNFFSFDIDLFNKRFDSRARIVNNNNITFVSKTALTHRAIAVEPVLNGYLQKGVDEFMRKRLKRVGIDLRDQSLNQRLAREGSARWKDPDCWCTIDLSSASDSVSIELCRHLLSPEWFDYLNSLRSHSYKLNGKVYPYHKFVSMGNGFCFPLETLIFASLCHAVCSIQGQKPDFMVYGDDILCRKSVFEPLLKALDTCGFKVNPKKTFSSGPFRESCGADWFEGEDVRPIILDYCFDSFQNIVKFCNIARSKNVWEDILHPCLAMLEREIPERIRLVRPYKGNPDTALEVPFDTFLASRFSRWNRKFQSWTWVELSVSAQPDKRVKRFARYHVALMRGALTGVLSPNPFTERFTSRTKVSRIRCGSTSSNWLPRMEPPTRYVG